MHIRYRVCLVAALLLVVVATSALDARVVLTNPEHEFGACIRDVTLWSVDSQGNHPTNFDNETLTGSMLNATTGIAYLKGTFEVCPQAAHGLPIINYTITVTLYHRSQLAPYTYTQIPGGHVANFPKTDGEYDIFANLPGSKLTIADPTCNSNSNLCCIGGVSVTVTANNNCEIGRASCR